MNIWGLLFITVLLFWLFCEYLRYVGKKLLELSKDYNKLVKMRKDMENTVIKFSKEIKIEKFEEVFEDTHICEYSNFLNEDMAAFCLENHNINELFYKYVNNTEKVKISAKKGKIVIERI